MRINLSEIFSFNNNRADVKTYNLSTSPMYAIDIFFTCSQTSLYNNILTPVLRELISDPLTRQDGTPIVIGDSYFNTTLSRIKTYDGASWVPAIDISWNSKVLIQIDGVIYPLKFGLPGESSTNPIIFKREAAFSKMHVKTIYGDDIDYIGGPNEYLWRDLLEISDTNNISSKIVPGTNLLVDDLVRVSFQIADGIIGE